MGLDLLDPALVGVAGAAAGCSTYPDSETTNVEGTNDGAAIATSNTLFGDGMIDFDGSDDKIDNANLPPYIRSSSTGSIAFWFRPSGAQAHGMYMVNMSEENVANYLRINFDQSNEKTYTNCVIGGTNQWEFSSSSTTPFLSWHHVAVVQNGTAIAAYVDGSTMTQSVTTDNTAWWTSGMDLFTIGAGEHPNPARGYEDFYYGAIQDMCIWDSAISSALVEYIYNSGTGRMISQICPTYDTNGIIAYFKCQSFDGTTLLNDATPTS